jgi:hypothetical protein
MWLRRMVFDPFHWVFQRTKKGNKGKERDYGRIM